MTDPVTNPKIIGIRCLGELIIGKSYVAIPHSNNLRLSCLTLLNGRLPDAQGRYMGVVGPVQRLFKLKTTQQTLFLQAIENLVMEEVPGVTLEDPDVSEVGCVALNPLTGGTRARDYMPNPVNNVHILCREFQTIGEHLFRYVKNEMYDAVPAEEVKVFCQEYWKLQDRNVGPASAIRIRGKHECYSGEYILIHANECAFSVPERTIFVEVEQK